MTLWFSSQDRQAAGSNPARDKYLSFSDSHHILLLSWARIGKATAYSVEFAMGVFLLMEI